VERIAGGATHSRPKGTSKESLGSKKLLNLFVAGLVSLFPNAVGVTLHKAQEAGRELIDVVRSAI